MKSGSVELKNKLSRLMGLTMVGLMVLSLTSGQVMAADEPKKDEDTSFKVWNLELKDGKAVEVKGFETNSSRAGLVTALRSKEKTFIADVGEHAKNPREIVEAMFGALKTQRASILKGLNTANDALPAEAKQDPSAVAKEATVKVAEFRKSLIERLGKIEDKHFGSKEKKEAFLKILAKEISNEDLEKMLLSKDKDALEKFLRKIFEGNDEELMKKLGITLKKPAETGDSDSEEPTAEERERSAERERARGGNRFATEAPVLGGNPTDTTPPANPNPNVGERTPIVDPNVDSLKATLQKCLDENKRLAEAQQDMFNKFRRFAEDLAKRLGGEEKPPAVAQVNPENELLKKLDGLLGEEEQPQVAQADQPQQAQATPPPSEKKQNNQIPQPLPPQQPGPQPFFANNTPSNVQPTDGQTPKATSVGKAAIAKANTVAEAVKPIAEMEAPAATQIVPPNPNLNPQQNAANINAYFDDAARYAKSYENSVKSSLAMVQQEKQNLAKQETALQSKIEEAETAEVAEKRPDLVSNIETAKAELEQAQSGLQSAERQAAAMMSSQDPNAAQAASQGVGAATEKIAAAKRVLAKAEQEKSAWTKANSKVKEVYEKRLETLDVAKTDLGTREKALSDRLKDATQLASKNEQNRQQSLAGINTQAASTQAANVNTISGFNPNNSSRRNQGLGGAINQSGTNSGVQGQRAPLGSTL